MHNDKNDYFNIFLSNEADGRKGLNKIGKDFRMNRINET
jgi:hypothetical protein